MNVDSTAPAIELKTVSRTFARRSAVDCLDLQITAGEMVALIGPSGAGKSTLLRLITGLIPSDRAVSSIKVHGKTVQENGCVQKQVRRIRADTGFIFQQFNLVGRLSLLTNVLVGKLAHLPLYRRQLRWFSYQDKLTAMEALDFVGMAEFAAQRASTLSGGQQQRGAIARAVVQRAKLILADEPIASLDPESARLVMDGLRRMNREEAATVLVSVHQIEHLAQSFDRVVGMREGRIIFDGPAGELDDNVLQTIYGPRPTPLDRDSSARVGSSPRVSG